MMDDGEAPIVRRMLKSRPRHALGGLINRPGRRESAGFPPFPLRKCVRRLECASPLLGKGLALGRLR
jgi:hypothetical protein